MNRFIRAFKNAVRGVLKNCLRVWLSSLRPVNPARERIERVLVFAYHGLGNFVMYTPALKLLRERYPDARIDLQVGNNTGCEEVLAGAGLFDNIYNCPYRAGVRTWLKRWLEIRKARYDVTINEFHSHSWLLAMTAVHSRA